MILELKCWPTPFEQIRIGTKAFDVRGRDDLEARAGDTILFREWDPSIGAFTGRELYAQITYQERTNEYPPAFGVPRAVVVSTFRVLNAQTPSMMDRNRVLAGRVP